MIRFMSVITQGSSRVFEVVALGMISVLVGYVNYSQVPIYAIGDLVETRAICAQIRAIGVP